MDRLQVVFLGTDSRISSVILNAIASAHQVVGVVEGFTHPRSGTAPIEWSKRQLRYLLCQYGDRVSLQYSAMQLRVPYFSATRQNRPELYAFLEQLSADIGCVASFPHLIPGNMLALPRYGFINCHPSLLPNYRGANPWFWQYYAMEQIGGVTIHAIDAGEDTGDILNQQMFIIEPGWPLATFKEKTAVIGAEMMVEVLTQIVAGTLHAVPQRHLPCAVHARSIKPDEPLIDWMAWSLPHVWHVLRGSQEELHALPLPVRGFTWLIQDYEPCACSEMPGTVQRDARGYYAAHAQGKIRLALRCSPRRLLHR